MSDPRRGDHTAWSFSCFGCRAELFQYTPHCPQCGAKHADEGRAFANAGRRYRRAWQPTEVRQEFERCKGWTAELGTFYLSHSEVEIRVWSDDDDWLLIYCSATERLEVTLGRWRCEFELTEQDRENRRYAIIDSGVGLRIVCRMVGVYVPNVSP